MEVSATANYIRVSPRKLQLLAKAIKRMKPVDATVALGFMTKSGSMPLKKLIMSALANAKSRNLAREDELMFKEIQVLPGGAMKRFRAVSRGMAHSYKKRMSHLKIILQEAPKTASSTKKVDVKIAAQPTVVPAKTKTEVKKDK